MLSETEEMELPQGLETADTIVSVKSAMKLFNFYKLKRKKSDISIVQSSLNKDGTEMKEDQ